MSLVASDDSLESKMSNFSKKQKVPLFPFSPVLSRTEEKENVLRELGCIHGSVCVSVCLGAAVLITCVLR